MIPDYADKSVAEALSEAEEMDGETLARFIEFEEENQNRVTLLRSLRRKVVRVSPASAGYVGGQWFDEADETRWVRKDSRVESAIESGGLQVVDDG